MSIIMPVLNEAAVLPHTLAALPLEGGQTEVILVDGGSTDESVALARRAGAKVVT
ncbi:glycosyl transferase, partial [Zobellella denitrificans]